MIQSMLVALIVWMLLCAWCGYRARLSWFVAALLAGLALTIVWVAMVLGAGPLEANALMGYASALLYALAAFGSGWIVGRFVRGWQASRIGQ